MDAKKLAEIYNGDTTLSFTSLKEFAESPKHFLDYKFKKKEVTDAMRFGTLLHTIVLEPETVKAKYVVFDRAKMPFPESTMNKKENKAYKADMMELAEQKGLEVVELEAFKKAKKLAGAVQGNMIASPLLQSSVEFEKFIQFEMDGFTWRGAIDGAGINKNIDLKKVVNANPHSVKYEAMRRKWHWQAYLYAYGVNPKSPFSVKHYNICVDEGANVSVNLMSREMLITAEEEILLTLKRYRQCLKENELFHTSYEFWAENDNGIFTIDW